jgi:hypothetical protein
MAGERISSVTDIPGWIWDRVKDTPPAALARTVGNAAMLPADAVADTASAGVHGALGLDEQRPYGYSRDRWGDVKGALSDAAAPVRSLGSAAGDAMTQLREALIARGARPKVAAPAAVAAAPGGDRPHTDGSLFEAPDGASSGYMDPGAVARGGKVPVPQKDGGISTEKTITVEADGKHYVIPTIINGTSYTPKVASDLFMQGKNKPIGEFKTAEEANRFAEQRSMALDKAFGGPGALHKGPSNPASGKLVDRMAQPDAFNPLPNPADQAAMAGALEGAEARPATGMGTNAGPQGALDAGPTAQPKSLQDQYAALIAKAQAQKGNGGKLTPEQQSQLRMDMYLGLLARGSKPGATLLGSVGESGLEVSGKARAEIEKNKAAELAAHREAMDEAFKQMGFADKDADNARGDRREARESKRDDRLDTRDRERIDILRRQAEQGKWKALPNVKTGTYQLYDQETGTTKDTGIKIDVANKEPAELQVLRAAQRDPALLQTLLAVKGKGFSDEDVVDKALKLVQGSMGQVSLDDAMAQIRRASGAPGGGTAGALPAGVPKGSKQIGTSKGKAVYETPEGKRLIAE